MRTSLLMITINNLKVMFKCINFSLYLMIYIIFYCYKILNASENEKCGKHCFQGTCQINCPQDSRENKKFMVYYGAKSGKEKREKKPHLKIVGMDIDYFSLFSNTKITINVRVYIFLNN